MRTRTLEAILARDDEERCLECATLLQPEFRCCPTCGDRVRTTCDGCGQPVRTLWTTCPWCMEPLAAPKEAAALSEVA